eukprot:CAMPEP_0168612824 /NCGR_PEP_ID=MMETSP0449_2-20121227/3122_1 /TAXON_ID=1082188 /ORGANISM="Strombidium rassoulzadegani, Strain ras09" /LENGTH=197 /DNA_ID=CAMNT_0008653413 /DNA_START=41 /DNA_END=631 /DNA_ORIENTATION=+
MLLMGTDSVSSKYTLFRKCPTDFTTQASLDLSQYAGRWYEFGRDALTPFEFGGDCVTATYGSLANGGTNDISVANRQFLWFILYPFTSRDVRGASRPTETAESSSRASAADDQFTDPPNYQILETDYTSYSLVYSCVENWAGASEDMWYLTREPSISDDLKQTLIDKVDAQIPSYNTRWSTIWPRQGDSCNYDNAGW